MWRVAPVQVPGSNMQASERTNEPTNERTYVRTVDTSANNTAAGPTNLDLTALTPFPALMTHRAVQLGFRANGNEILRAVKPLNPGSTLTSTDAWITRMYNSLSLFLPLSSLSLSFSCAIKRTAIFRTMIHLDAMFVARSVDRREVVDSEQRDGRTM